MLTVVRRTSFLHQGSPKTFFHSNFDVIPGVLAAVRRPADFCVETPPELLEEPV